ncbi:phytoene/squalene synthase family protein [Paenibacillus aurantius]|uniref:Phytoene/squalene synthase family protein n=1 Tax=Paenibacillus aurantius TaxID=2918900 RepID=A0AA96LBM0_9BACL|nr:phytoene/squalene synthase family protein [Paenibacillus aurantius]WNQ09061.1 phytoene/squalene synthase family protein [Paenibacillus aurantius]
MKMLADTSRTFYIPISRLKPGLKEAVASAYLCMRAIDEIEDHPEMEDSLKIQLLKGIGQAFEKEGEQEIYAALDAFLAPYRDSIPEVSLRISDWASLCPTSIAPTVFRYIQEMSLGMAHWVERKWEIRTEEDLDQYTYCVAGAVGEMLSDLWAWYDDTKSDPVKAVAFGRGLQSVNILRNRSEDGTRGVNFFPEGWGMDEMVRYTRRNLKAADEYISELKKGPALDFCRIPLALAHATVNIIASGGSKLTRAKVLDIVARVRG